MIMYETNNELMHYGVLGMKWGARRAKTQPLRNAKRDARVLKRNLASDKRNVLMRGKVMDAADKNYTQAKQKFRKEYSKTISTWNQEFASPVKIRDKIEKADSEVKKARSIYTASKNEFKRAEKGYSETEQQYKKQLTRVNSLLKKYGSTKVKHITTSEYKIGKNKYKKMIATGATVSDIPFYGRYRTSKYIVERDYKL